MNGVHLLTSDQLDEFITITGDAYPALNLALPDTKERTIARMKQRMEQESINFYGYFRDGQLLGGMILYDYLLNFRSIQIPVGGVGMVAVDFLHKKEKVAKELITFFIDHYRERKMPLALLYPFRPDFYKQMGFGFGTKNNQYKVLPSAFPSNGEKRHLQYLTKEDVQLVRECYDRLFAHTHGMIKKTDLDLRALFDNPENRLVGVKKGDTLHGYIVFSFKQEHELNFALNNMIVKEFIYETPEVLSEICTFLNSQSDQINRIVINTQDEFLHHLFDDARNGDVKLIPHVAHPINVAAIGLMYRVINQDALWSYLAHHNFDGVNCKVKLTVHDSFINGSDNITNPPPPSTIVHFVGGYPTRMEEGEEYEVEVKIGVADFSSMLMGVVPFSKLVSYGLAEVSNTEYVKRLGRIFQTSEKPICTTMF
ncbi:GNAT family N-acetyltransferase [Brevibacillus ginsengisoli]|uniref:GNAT family N-acetyltransferase n=1 Tax=Brevibacillus ginsengisoli TaxID=363854 RepID=UPI003CE7B6F2